MGAIFQRSLLSLALLAGVLVAAPTGAGASTAFAAAADTVGGEPGVVALEPGDIDDDGDLDVVSVNFDADTVTWFESNGASTPTWTEHNIATLVDGARWVDVADIDRDGDLDAAVSSFNDDTIAWYINDGTPAVGAWTEVVVNPTADGARMVHVADVDRDGDPDLVTAHSTDDDLSWFENDGTPAGAGWTERVISLNVDGIRGVSVADVDDDGDPDVLGASEVDSDIDWFENDGTPADGAWTERNIDPTAVSARTAVAGDADGDGDLDVLAASPGDDTVAVHRNDGTPADGGWTTDVVSTTVNFASTAVFADMDADGDLDILASEELEQDALWFENDGEGEWDEHRLFTGSAFSTPAQAVPGDVDGDGDPDAVMADFGSDVVRWVENLELPVIELRGGTGTEGGTVNFTMSVDQALSAPLTVSASTASGTAVEGVDFTLLDKDPFTIPAGATSATIPVSTTEDARDEANETFTLSIDPQQGNSVEPSFFATGTIRDDDPLPALTISDRARREGDDGRTLFRFRVELSARSNRTVKVRYVTVEGTATAPRDFVAKAGTLTFPPGALARNAVVTVKGDTRVEPAEVFKVRLFGAELATFADRVGKGTIRNDD